MCCTLPNARNDKSLFNLVNPIFSSHGKRLENSQAKNKTARTAKKAQRNIMFVCSKNAS
jgi:hypothetical protein